MDINPFKICKNCNVKKDLSNYHTKAMGKFHKDSVCIPCRAVVSKEKRLNNYEKYRKKEKEYKANNRELVKSRERIRYANNREAEAIRKKESRKLHGHKENEQKRLKRQDPKVKAKELAYVKNRYKTNINFRLSKLLRQRHAHFCWKLKVNKMGSSVKDLGCSLEEFKLYLESRFENWMTWENHGRYSRYRKTWHIDHIIPLIKFNLSNREEYLKAAHYTNMQPLEAIVNLRKNRF